MRRGNVYKQDNGTTGLYLRHLSSDVVWDGLTLESTLPSSWVAALFLQVGLSR